MSKSMEKRGPEWELIAEAIRHRDGKECQGCGLAQGNHRTKLHVHHIRRPEGLLPEEKHDDRNLVTVCHPCHRRLDRQSMTVDRQLEELGFNSLEDIPEVPRLPDDLRDVDRTILSYLAETPVTPAYARKRLKDDVDEYSRGYVQQRLARLEEHGHAVNLLDSGLYSLVDDPREDSGSPPPDGHETAHEAADRFEHELAECRAQLVAARSELDDLEAALERGGRPEIQERMKALKEELRDD